MTQCYINFKQDISKCIEKSFKEYLIITKSPTFIKNQLNSIFQRKILEYNQLKALIPTIEINTFYEQYQKALEIKEFYNNNQTLQDKLSDAQASIENFLDSKISLNDRGEYLQNLIQERKQLQQQIDNNNNPKYQYTIEYFKILERYQDITNNIMNYNDFQNDMLELVKLQQRMEFILNNDNYLEYSILIEKEQVIVDNDESYFLYFKYLSECLKNNNINNILIITKNITNIQSINVDDYREEFQYNIQNIICLIKSNNHFVLIIINRIEKQTTVITNSINRIYIKNFLLNFQQEFPNYNIKWILLKIEQIQQLIFQEVMNTLEQVAKVIMFQQMITTDQLIEKMKIIIQYQQHLPFIDYFQFLDFLNLQFIDKSNDLQLI